jgi:hypothetical protein
MTENSITANFFWGTFQLPIIYIINCMIIDYAFPCRHYIEVEPFL